MADPSSKCTVTIGEWKFNAMSVQMGITTLHDHAGLPHMGTMASTINVEADMNDNGALPFSTLQGLFALSNIPDKTKLNDIKIEFWTDETKDDVICAFNFSGWISSFFAISNEKTNHMLSITLVPELTSQQYFKIDMSN